MPSPFSFHLPFPRCHRSAIHVPRPQLFVKTRLFLVLQIFGIFGVFWGGGSSAAHTRIPTRLLVVAARMGPKNRKLTLTARLRLFWGFQRACWSSSSQPEEEEEFEEEDEAAPSRSSRPAIKITGEKTGCESSIYGFNIHYIYYIAPVAPALTPAPAPACGHPRIPACGHWCVVGAGAGGCVCVRAQPSLTRRFSPPPRAPPSPPSQCRDEDAQGE